MPTAETLRRVDKSSASHENGSVPRMSSLQLVNGKRNVKAKSQLYSSCCGPGQLSRYSDSLRLDGPGIEYRWGPDFPHPSTPALGPTQPPMQGIRGLFPRSKAVRGVALTTHHHLAPRLKKKYSCTSTSPLGFHGLF